MPVTGAGGNSRTRCEVEYRVPEETADERKGPSALARTLLVHIPLSIEVDLMWMHINDWPCSGLYCYAALCASVDWAGLGLTGTEWAWLCWAMLGLMDWQAMGWTDRMS